MKRYYFDWAATAPPDYFEDGLDIDGGGTAGGAFSLSDIPFGNPSSLHSEGRAARAALEEARRRCASLLQTAPERLFWTSGGTESNFLVLSSILRRSLNSQGAILSSAVEHASIDKSAASFKALGLPFNFIKPEKTGAISEAALKKSLVKHKETALISIIHVQNEVGFINDIAALVRRAKENARRGVHFHCDMVQSLGKIPLSLEDWGVDSASFSAHKIGGPRGIGLLYLKKRLVPLFADESAGGVAGAGGGSAGFGNG